MNKIAIVVSFLFLHFTCEQFCHDLLSEKALQEYIAAEQKDESLGYDAMARVFSNLSVPVEKLLQAIRADMSFCRRQLRKHSSTAINYNELLVQLRRFYRYVRQHKDCCRAIHFHQQLQNRYALAFNNPSIASDVERNPELHGMGLCKYKCRSYCKQVKIDLALVDQFEDLIHADFSILKAHNYVYKIELIRIRNFIYHTNLYKYQTRYF